MVAKAKVPTDRARDAHYHPVRATAAWKAFVQSQLALATDSPAQRATREAQRVRETTYARAEQGGH